MVLNDRIEEWFRAGSGKMNIYLASPTFSFLEWHPKALHLR